MDVETAAALFLLVSVVTLMRSDQRELVHCRALVSNTRQRMY